jgi:hypothetical protein
MKCVSLLLLSLVLCVARGADELPARWSAARANNWYANEPWLVGANYAPAYASNQLEMWQAASWDPVAIERELTWAHELGFNVMRVFLHDLAWQDDPAGFLARFDQFLGIAARKQIAVMPVFFDGVWDPNPRSGPQPAPRPHLHNSRWLQSPGAAALADEAQHARLERYVKAVLERHRDDRRIIVWDLFNEPDNPNASSYPTSELPNKAEAALVLLRKAFRWAREINPSQPLTAGVWRGNWDPAAGPVAPMTQFMLEQSDVISFHNYDPLAKLQAYVDVLQKLGRPMLCTEYFARPRDSRFETILPYFQQHRIAAFNWGFVAGRSQTIYPWDSWREKFTAEPKVWFHDILRTDGTPYDTGEVAFLKKTLRR